MRVAAIGVHPPHAGNMSQVIFAERDQEVEALSPKGADQAVTKGVGLRRLGRGAEDADAHRGDSGVDPGE